MVSPAIASAMAEQLDRVNGVSAHAEPKSVVEPGQHEIKLALIRTDGGTQSRAELNSETISDYAEAMQDGALFPPVVVFYDGSAYWLADGFHRVAAARRLDMKVIFADVRQGSLRDAVLFSVGANGQHGLRRTNADKRRAVEVLLRDEEWQAWSNVRIAEKCGVNDKTVAVIRQDIFGSSEDATRRVNRNGKAYTVNTSKIGKSRKGKKATEPTPQKKAAAQDIANQAFNRKVTALALSLEGASDTITEFVTTSGVDDPERVEILKRLEKSAGSPETNGTFDEIMRTGGFHFGSEEHERVKEFATAPIQQIQRGLDAIAKTHAVVAAQGREAENEAARRANALRVLQMSESNEWYTPAQYVNAARALMGSIDLDPATSAVANEVVQAAQIYTFETDGLAQNWHGNVWLNPPYGRDEGESNQAIWTARLIEQYAAGNITQAVLLVNAVTDRQWFQPLWDYPICFTNHRIKFYKPSKDAGSPTMGSVLVYFGANREGFANAFKQFGAVVMNSVRA